MSNKHLVVGSSGKDFTANISLEEKDGQKVLNVNLVIVPGKRFDKSVSSSVDKTLEKLTMADDYYSDDVIYIKKALQNLLKQIEL